MEVQSGANINLHPMKDLMPEQLDARRSLGPCGYSMLEQAPGRTCSPVEEKPTLEQVINGDTDQVGSK
ncbi:hypothetical protein BTVI_144366 [Pitangus sulphuratus]|nr:hypothetical protein BTVI_144366 [Pitangus sulphuratus]